MTHQLVIVIIATTIAETTFRNGILTLWSDRTVEHGKEKILQNALIIFAIITLAKQIYYVMRCKSFYKFRGYILLVEELVGHQMTLL